MNANHAALNFHRKSRLSLVRTRPVRRFTFGECCRHRIDELATHIYGGGNSISVAPPDQQLCVTWILRGLSRCLSSGRYILLARCFGGRLRRCCGIAERRDRVGHVLPRFFSRIYSDRAQSTGAAFRTRNWIGAVSIEQFSFMGEHQRTRTFVSCWHSNTGESEALWRLLLLAVMIWVAIKNHR